MDTIVTPVTVITLDSTRIVHNVKADFTARFFPPVVRLVQYDQSLPVIAVSLMQNGQTYTLPSGAAANIRVHKPDATYVYNPALGCDSTRNIVYFEVTQAMAAANGDGLAIVEIVVDGDIAGTSLITLHFEENPVPEDAIESSDEWETIYELGERIIASTVTPVSTAAGMTDHNVVYLYTGTESGWNQGHMYYYNGTTWVDAGIAVTDTTLSVAGLAADAKKTGDEITALKEDLGEITKNLIPLKNINQTSNGVTITTDSGSGKVTATGRSTAAGYINITDVITLPVGTYTISPNASNHLYFQARSTSNVILAQTGVGTTATFTLSEQTSLNIRATWTASFNETAEAYPQMESGSSATYFLPHMIADDDYARYMIGKLEDKALTFCGTLTNGADFNSADKIGYYLTNFSASYVNDPISGTNHRKALINVANQDSVPFIVQFLLNYDSANTILYYRMRSAGTWTDWRLMYRQTDVETLKSNVSNLLGLASDNTVITNTDMVVSSSPANVGTNITVMSYNVANYNDDTTTYISDAKRTNYRKMLSQINPDFIGLQEAKEYIDGSNTHNAMDYIYRPMFPSHIIGSGGSILAKQGAPDTYDNMAFSNGRNLLFGRYAIGNKKLMMITAHPVAGTDASAVSARLTQYTELIQFANREIQLTSADGRRTKYCPEWDYCIICADCNSITDDDKTNLKSLASGGGFTMANGGWLGWLETARNTSGSIVYSIDNILCSSNIIINSITAHKGLYTSLYSDHYPLSAEVTLLS